MAILAIILVCHPAVTLLSPGAADMATIRQRGNRWQCIIKRKGYPLQSKTFDLRKDAERWARQQESPMDAGHWLDRTEAEQTTLAALLDRYGTEVSSTKRGCDAEQYRIKQFKRSSLAKYSPAAITSQMIANWRDERLKEVSSGTVLRELQLLGQGNFLVSTMMVLDFDNGEVSPDDFKRIFWNDAGSNKRSFIMMNSFSRSEEQPNRFRVVLPYKQPAVHYQEHLAIFNSIVERLAQNGFSFEKSGLDRSCANGTQPFLLPCTNRNQQTWHLFEAVGLQKRDIERHAIDPSTYLKTSLSQSEGNIVVSIDRLRMRDAWDDVELAAKLRAIKLTVTSLRESHRIPFYSAGKAMLGINLPLHEIEQELTQLAHEIGKSHENWVAETMKTLRNKSVAAA